MIEAYPNADSAGTKHAIADYFATPSYNFIHKAIADALAGAALGRVVTTNYDVAIENAMRALGADLNVLSIGRISSKDRQFPVRMTVPCI